MEKDAGELIELIARAAINTDGWHDVLTRMAELLPGTKIMLAAGDAQFIANAGAIYTGFSDWSMQAYADHFAKVNPWTPYLMQLPTMLAAVSDEVMPSTGFQNTEFYQDWLMREGEIDHATGVKIFHGRDRQAAVFLHYGDSIAERYNAEIRPLLQQLAPLFRMALEVNRQLSQTLPHCEIIGDLIEGFLAAACLENEQRKMLLANRSFLEEIRSRQYLAVDRFDRIKPANACDERKFEEMVRGAARPHDTSRDAQPLTMFLSGEEQPPASLTVLGIRAGARSGLPWLANPQSYALVILGNPTSRKANVSREFAAKFALTRAETRLLQIVGTGENLRNAADQLGISYETARSQLKVVFAKTDVHRQAELVALMARIA